MHDRGPYWPCGTRATPVPKSEERLGTPGARHSALKAVPFARVVIKVHEDIPQSVIDVCAGGVCFDERTGDGCDDVLLYMSGGRLR